MPKRVMKILALNEYAKSKSKKQMMGVIEILIFLSSENDELFGFQKGCSNDCFLVIANACENI